jgi:hypothetical protein
MARIIPDTTEGVFDPAPTMQTPSTSPGSPVSGSSNEAGDEGLLDDSFTSLSGNTSTLGVDEMGHDAPNGNKYHMLDSLSVATDLHEAFAENILAKTCRVAVEALHRGAKPHDGIVGHTLPDTQEAFFPEYCPQAGDDAGKYVLRESEFWTCGFFPGTLYALLERAIRFPQSLEFSPSRPERPSTTRIRTHLSSLCRAWAEPLHNMASRTDTHDIGFIIMPALRLDWELTSNERSLASIVRAAHSLASRYIPSARAIRSWDLVRRKDMEIIDQDNNLILIIDSMCNLDLLYYAAAHSGDTSLSAMATAHATTLLTTHLRPESPPAAKTTNGPTTAAPNSSGEHRYAGQWFSTCHVANLDPKTGALKRRFTAQGYADDSAWARGQAWAILGYVQAYTWAKDPRFLRAACGCAEYFLYRLETSSTATATTTTTIAVGSEEEPESDGPVREEGTGRTEVVGRYVPLWDFDAPVEDAANPTRDSSAGVIAANGMLVLSQALAAVEGQEGLARRFREKAVAIVGDTLAFALAREKVQFQPGVGRDGGLVPEDVVEGSRFDALLKFGTANNNAVARKRYANHGLVYGDYYLVEFGNRLLRMGLV